MYSTQNAAKNPQYPPSEPLACRRCGAITLPLVTPGTGPYTYKTNYPYYGDFMKSLSKFTPEEQAARREAARREAARREAARREVMAQRPPSPPQLAYLKSLGDTAPAPANMAEASLRIDTLRKGVA